VLTIRYYLALQWVGLKVLRRFPLRDRWGFNLGEDLDEWAVMRMFGYLEKLRAVTGWERVQVTGPPPVQVTGSPLVPAISGTWATPSTWTYTAGG